MDERAKNHVVALLAKVFSMTSSALASAADDPERFDLAMDNSLAALQIAISRCHELDESLVRVSLISVNRAAGWPQYNGALPDSELSVRSVPGDRMRALISVTRMFTNNSRL